MGLSVQEGGGGRKGVMAGGWARLNSNWISRSVGSRTKACGALLRGEEAAS